MTGHPGGRKVPVGISSSVGGAVQKLRERADDVKAIAASYATELSERSNEFEQLRHLPQDLADRLAQDGLYHVCTPAEQGGRGLPPRAYAEVVELLAKSDASAAWCVFIGITTAFSLASAETEDIEQILRKPGVITRVCSHRTDVRHGPGEMGRTAISSRADGNGAPEPGTHTGSREDPSWSMTTAPSSWTSEASRNT